MHLLILLLFEVMRFSFEITKNQKPMISLLPSTGNGPAPQLQPNAGLQPVNNNPSDSTIDVSGQFDMFPVPPAMTQVIASATGGGALAINAYFLNEPFFTTTATNNGSGAASVTNTYGDGFTGKGYNQLAAGSDGGIKCYGFTLQYATTATGAQNNAGLNTAAPTILVANLVGANTIPRGLVLAAGARNTQYLAGVMTVRYRFNLNTLSQFQYAIPVGNTVTLTVLTQPF